MKKKVWSTRKTRINKAEIIKLREKGLTYDEIGKKVGCSGKYAGEICNPEMHEKHNLYVKKHNNERYHKDPKFRKAQLKASTNYIMDKYYNCPAFRENQREYDRIRWNTKRSPIIKSEDILFKGFARRYWDNKK
jgi:hypothetical protein